MKEIRLKVEIARLSLSDLGCGVTPKRKIPYIHIRFSTDREPVGSGEIARFRSDFTHSGEGGSPLHGG
jgi:hypothetical protein